MSSPSYSTLSDLEAHAYGLVRRGAPPEEIARIAEKAASLWDLADGKRDRALRWYKVALERQPNRPFSLSRARHLYVSEGRIAEAVALMDKAIEYAEGNAQDVSDLTHEKASLLLEHCGAWEDAAALWREVLVREPSHAAANRALKALYVAHECWDALIELHEWELVAITNPDAGKRVLEIIAQIYRTQSNDRAAEVQTLRRILGIRPDDVPTLEKLCEALQESGEFEQAAKHMRALVRLTDQTQWRRALAELLENKLGDRRGALAEYLTLLHSGVEHGGKGHGGEEHGNREDPDTLTHIANLAAELKDWSSVAFALGHRLEQLPESERFDTHVQIGNVALNRLHSHSIAVEHFEAALRTRYDRSVFFSLITALQNLATKTDDRDEQARAYKRIALLMERYDDDEPAAIEAWDCLLGVTDDEYALYRTLTWYRNAGDSERVLDRVTRLYPLVQSDEARIELLLEKSEVLFEIYGDVRGAEQTLLFLLQHLDSQNAVALGLLADVYAWSNRYEAQADMLERLLSVVETPRDKASIAEQLFRVCDDHLYDADRAKLARQVWLR